MYLNSTVKTCFRFLWLLVWMGPFLSALAQEEESPRLNVAFQDNSVVFESRQKEMIVRTIRQTDQHIRTLLPDLPDTIHVTVSPVDWDLEIVGGVSGRSDSHTPIAEVVIWISHTYPGGIEAAIGAGLNSAIYHEFHHLARGWTMKGNLFGPGIPNAAVNEGLAVVFAETYTGRKEEGNQYPNTVHSWVTEILELPLDADYQQWVSGFHPDGRSFIGYRAGNYIVQTAMQRSGKGILELSRLSPDSILDHAGFSRE